MRRFEQVLSLIFTIGIFTAIIFFVLRYAGVETGSFTDWIVGFVASSWLITVTIIPWNVYFEAKTVLSDAELSRKKGINFDEKEIKYVVKVAQNALYVAILLHIVSSGALYALAYFKISMVGYYGSAASLLLTFLRPAVRAYQYISDRLANIRAEVLYPRDDVHEVKSRVEEMEETVKLLASLMNESDSESWRRRQEKTAQKHFADLKDLQKQLDNLREMTNVENERILKETQKAVAQVNQDGKFVDKFVENLVEIVRFIKRA